MIPSEKKHVLSLPSKLLTIQIENHIFGFRKFINEQNFTGFKDIPML